MRRTFAIATRDELWIRGTLAESRLSHGVTIESGSAIEARDAADEELIRLADERTGDLRCAIDPSFDRVRVVTSARRVEGKVSVSSTLTLAIGDLSVVTTPQHVDVDRRLLREIASANGEGAAVDYHDVPIVWRNGSAAVLMHEAAGHPAEDAHAPLRWPEWVRATDEPEGRLDDRGFVPRAADLLASEMPQAWRRESFRDVPLRRMSRLIVRQEGATFVEPPVRIDVHLVAHGTYDTLTEVLTLKVAAADLVDGASVRRLPPFWIREHRAAVPAALLGATGEPLRYPGVVCSLEGQEVVVDSFAPVILTRFR